jgi:hypothetical protein
VVLRSHLSLAVTMWVAVTAPSPDSPGCRSRSSCLMRSLCSCQSASAGGCFYPVSPRRAGYESVKICCGHKKGRPCGRPEVE